MYVCMCVAIHVHHVRALDAATLLGKGWQPQVNSKYCLSKLSEAPNLSSGPAGRGKEKQDRLCKVEGYRRQWNEAKTRAK